MKYILMMTGTKAGVGTYRTWSEQDRQAHMAVLTRIQKELRESGEFVASEALAAPDQATLVPEKREELTTEGGLDVVTHQKALTPVVKRLQGAGIEVVFFVDPDEMQIETARLLGGKALEIQTARYSEARTPEARDDQLAALRTATEFALDRGLHVHMGHGLNYTNVQAVAAIPGVEELNIGHSIVARAVLVGLERAVRAMKEAIREGEGLRRHR